MIRVRTGSRLHFGLLNLATAEWWPDMHGQAVLPARCFGGAGMMVERPGVQLLVQPADAWSAEGPLAERALGYARQFVRTLALPVLRPYRLVIEATSPEHKGLGTGTQLGLAVARALAVACGLPEVDASELAHRVGRGGRSALGIHGFAQGGFLVDAGKRSPEQVAPLVARHPVPASWRIVLVVPPWGMGRHSDQEQEAFQCLARSPGVLEPINQLCRLVLLGMLPALAEQDLQTFGQALHEFNFRAGQMFAPVQGGVYADPRVAELVSFVRRQRVPGVGQSSWGPAVFALVEDEDQADFLARAIRLQFGLGATEVFLTRAWNQGAVTETLPVTSGPCV